MNTYIQKRLAKIQMTLDEMSGGYRRMVAGMKKLGFAGSLKAIWDDLFANRSLAAWGLPSGFRKFPTVVGALL